MAWLMVAEGGEAGHFFGSNGHGDGYFLMEMVVECWEMGEISPFGMVIFQYFPWLNG
jgi:hypothetical protein